MATDLQKLQAELVRREIGAIRKLVDPVLTRLQRLPPSLALRKLNAIRTLLKRYSTK